MAVAITLRSVKGSPLTIPEVDTNFTNLKNGIDGQQAAVDAAVAAVNGMDARVDVLEAASTDYSNRIVALETGGGGGFTSNEFFAASKNANQSFPVNNSIYSVKVSYNVESADVGGAYDPTNSIFTAPETGWYYFTASVRMDMTSSSTPVGINNAIFFMVNGGGGLGYSEGYLPDSGSTSGQTLKTSVAIQLNLGDTVETRFSAVCFSGSMTWQLTTGGDKAYFQGWRVA